MVAILLSRMNRIHLYLILCPRSILALEGVSLQILHPWRKDSYRMQKLSLHFYSLSLYRVRGGRAAGVGWADTNTNITFCTGRGSPANRSHRAPSWATLSAGDPEENSSSRNRSSSLKLSPGTLVRFFFALGLPRRSENICIN